MTYKFHSATSISSLRESNKHTLVGAETFPADANLQKDRVFIMGLVKQMADQAGREVDIAEQVNMRWHTDVFDGDRQLSKKGVSIYGRWFDIFWKWED